VDSEKEQCRWSALAPSGGFSKRIVDGVHDPRPGGAGGVPASPAPLRPVRDVLLVPRMVWVTRGRIRWVRAFGGTHQNRSLPCAQLVELPAASRRLRARN